MHSTREKGVHVWTIDNCINTIVHMSAHLKLSGKPRQIFQATVWVQVMSGFVYSLSDILFRQQKSLKLSEIIKRVIKEPCLLKIRQVS